MALIVLDMTRNRIEDPVPLFATLIFLAPLVAIWPSRKLTLIWIPLLLMCVFLAIVHSITPQPLGVYASIGVLLALIVAAHAMIADAGVGGKPPELVAAEAWLRSQRPRRKEWRPYLEAVGIEKPDKNGDEDDDWGHTHRP